jgi:hypothetical protein
VTGSFGASVDFGAGLVNARGSSDLFLAKYSPAGTAIWVKTFGTNAPFPSTAVGNALALDRFGNVIIAGNFQSTLSLGGAPLPYSGYNDIFLVKYSAVDGSHQWSKPFGGVNTDYGASVAVDNSGNITLTGQMGSPLNFGTGALSGVNGAINIYIANFAADGTPHWSKGVAVGNGNVKATTVNSSGHWFVAGCFSSSANFGCGAINSSGMSDIFLAEFAP